jgi:HSP20 family protein
MYLEEKMMTITRWNPYRDVIALQNRVNSLFRDLNQENDPVASASFVPAVDIYEDAQKVVLKLEVPGVDQKDLDVRVENHTLTVKGERKFEAEEPLAPEKEKNFLRIERRYGSFYRAFTLPSTVDTENVGASYNAGVLKLELKKKAETQPRQIEIKMAA